MKIWNAVYHLIRFRTYLFLVSLILWTLVHGLPLLTGVMIKEIFNALSLGQLDEMSMLVFFLAMVFMVRAIAIVAGLYADFTFVFTVAALLRKNVLTGLFKKPSAKVLPKSVGDAISRFRDDIDEIAGFCGWIADLIYRPLFVVACLGIMFSISVKLTLITLIPLAITLFISNYAKSSVEKYRRESREATGAVTGFLAGIFQGVEVIKSFGAIERVVDYLEKLNRKRQQLSVKDRVYSELLHTIFYNSIFLGTGLILVFAADDMMNGSFTIGDMALFIFYLGWLSEMNHFIGRLMARFRQASVSFHRATELQGSSLDQLVQHGKVYLNEKEEKNASLKYPVNRKDLLEKLQIKGLTYVYDEKNGGKGIYDVSIIIPKGTLTVITGEVGSGKSTLLKTIIGVLPKQKGKILWNDQIIVDAGTFFVPPRCSYCPQIPRLLKGTIRENILLGKAVDDQQLAYLIHKVNLDKDLTQWKDGLETLVGAMGTKLSGGQRQRVAIARALTQNSELLFLDDIFSSLDTQTEQILMKNLFVKGKTIIAVSHRKNLLQMADQILVMKEGRVICQGPYEEVYRTSDYVRSLV